MGQTFIVSNAAELSAALNDASGGDRIELEAGEYGELQLTRVSFDGEGVTIASVDAENMAVFDKIGLYDSSNLHFDQIEIDYEPTGNTGYSAAFRSDEGDNISLTNSVLTGGIPDGATAPAGAGIQIMRGDDILIEGNYISEFRAGMNIAYIDGLKIIGNDIHDLRTSPISGGGVGNVEISGNHFSSSNPVNLGGTGDHADLIHLYPLTNQEGPMENIIIRDNFLEQGSGSDAILGIYIDDAGGGGSGLGYTNVVIENNVLHNGDAQGIRVENVDGLSIRDNTLLQSSGDNGDAPGIVLTSGTQNVVIDNNIIAGAISGSSVATADGGPLNVVLGDNLFVQSTNPNGANYVDNLFVNGLTADGDIWDFAALEGSGAEGYGSTLPSFDLPDGAYAGLVSDDHGSGLDSLSVTLDVQSLYGADGEIDFSYAQISWDFGDGSTGTGDNIEHTYDAAGSYDVTASFTFGDGTQIDIDKTVDMVTPDAIAIDFENGIRDDTDIPNRIETFGNVTTEADRFGDALRLGSDGARVEVGRSGEILNNQEYTISLAFKKDGGTELNSDDGSFVYYSGSVYMATREGLLAVSGFTSTGDSFDLSVRTSDIEDGEWHHMTYTFSSFDQSAVLYLDGVEVDREDGVTGIQKNGTSGHDFNLGGRTDGAFGGLMDEVEFTRAALTAEEVEARYETLFGIEPDPVQETDPVSEREPVVVEPSEPVTASELVRCLPEKGANRPDNPVMDDPKDDVYVLRVVGRGKNDETDMPKVAVTQDPGSGGAKNWVSEFALSAGKGQNTISDPANTDPADDLPAGWPADAVPDAVQEDLNAFSGFGRDFSFFWNTQPAEPDLAHSDAAQKASSLFDILTPTETLSDDLPAWEEMRDEMNTEDPLMF